MINAQIIEEMCKYWWETEKDGKRIANCTWAEAKEEWLTGVETIGVTSGASVPEILVDDLLKWLAERGFADVETVTAAQESLLFALPPELRKDIKAAAQG
jgi:4-hydroxy-3-methylbut-2-enyl diphosphate reductase IspH